MWLVWVEHGRYGDVDDSWDRRGAACSQCIGGECGSPAEWARCRVMWIRLVTPVKSNGPPRL
jgi:hypothetical protein